MKFTYQGKIYKNCNSTGAQKSALANDTAFGQELQGAYNTDFSESQGLFNELNNSLESIVAAGPNQQGMSPEELAAENSQAINSAAAENQQVQAAIGEKAGAMDTANPGVENGVEAAVQAGAASKNRQQSCEHRAGHYREVLRHRPSELRERYWCGRRAPVRDYESRHRSRVTGYWCRKGNRYPSQHERRCE